MRSLQLDWNKVFEFTWRILVFIVIILFVTTNWNRWEGRYSAGYASDHFL